MEGGSDLELLSVDDILVIHEVIVESSDETTAGVASEGDIEYALEHVESGHFGQEPETIHERAYQLLRLLVANHPFVDGNKRTALASTVALYALNGYDLDYDRDIKTLLKQLATDESTVEQQDVVQYLEDHTTSLPAEYDDTYRLWLSVAASATEFSAESEYDRHNRE